MKQEATPDLEPQGQVRREEALVGWPALWGSQKNRHKLSVTFTHRFYQDRKGTKMAGTHDRLPSGPGALGQNWPFRVDCSFQAKLRKQTSNQPVRSWQGQTGLTQLLLGQPRDSHHHSLLCLQHHREAGSEVMGTNCLHYTATSNTAGPCPHTARLHPANMHSKNRGCA